MHPTSTFIRALLALRNDRRTGLLTVDAEETRTFVYYRDGVPVFAEEGSQGETLGRLLVRLGKLTHEQYVAVIQRMTDALVLNEQLRFGEVAVELGLLTENEVRGALIEQVRWKIVRTLQRTEVKWRFEDSVSLLDGVGNVPMRIESLVLDAVRWVDDDQKNAMALDAMRGVALRVDGHEVGLLVDRFDLDREEAHFVASLDGRTVEQALASNEAKVVDAPAVLTALLATRSVATAAEPRLPRPFTPAFEIKPQKPEVSRPPPPAADATVAARTPAAQTRAASVLEALESRRVRIDPDRAPRDEHEARLLAEESCQRGLAEVRAGRYASATEAFARCVGLVPTSKEYELYARWSALRARGELHATAAERNAVGHLALRATRSDPNFAFGFYVAGVAALDDERPELAQRLLLRAQKLDPSLVDVGRQLRLVQRRLDGH